MEEVQHVIEPAYEFDAPQFFDFGNTQPESPSQTDAWFDRGGPKGSASPGLDPDPGPVSEEPMTTQDVPAVVASVAVAAAALETSAAAQSSAEVVHPIKKIARGIGNIVTSWGNAPAKRVLASSVETGTAVPEVSDAVEHVSATVELPVVKREGFITPRAPKPAKSRPGPKPVPPKPSASFDKLQCPLQMGGTASDIAPVAESEKVSTKPASAAELPPQARSPKTRAAKKRALLASSDTAKEAKENIVPAKKQKKEFTTPTAPNLATSSRSRPPRYKTREQLEEEEMASIPKFKARPNPSNQSGGSPSSRYKRQKLARPACDQSPTPSEEQHAFKARPLDPRILQGPTFIPKHEVHEATLPTAPVFATDSRIRGQKSEEQPSTGHSNVTAKRKRQSSLSWQQASTTEPVPFKLATDLRGQSTEAAIREARLKKEEAEKQKIQFHALPVPKTTHVAVAVQKPNPVLTMPEPFKLESEKRHEEAKVLQELLNQQAREEEQKQKQFKARQMPKGQAYQPAASERLLTVPEPFMLPGDQRSLQRAQFDAATLEREHAEEERRRAEEEERQKQEADAVKALRKSMQFKARPMPSYSSQSGVQPPPLKWTDPVSPKFETAARAKQRVKHA